MFKWIKNLFTKAEEQETNEIIIITANTDAISTEPTETVTKEEKKKARTTVLKKPKENAAEVTETPAAPKKRGRKPKASA